MRTAQDFNESSERDLDTIQGILDAAGLLIDPADSINGTISLARGKYTEAALSYSASVPFIGIAATTAKEILKHFSIVFYK